MSEQRQPTQAEQAEAAAEAEGEQRRDDPPDDDLAERRYESWQAGLQEHGP